MELKRLQQQQLRCQQRLTLSGSSCSSHVVGSHVESTRPTSAAISRSVSATDSLPFELPDVNISDLLSTTVQPSSDVRSPVLAYQRTSSTSVPVSPASSASSHMSSRKLSCTDKCSEKKGSNKKKVSEKCRQNHLRNVNSSSTASDNNLPVAKTLPAGDSRKRQSSTHSTLAVHSDDEFEDLHCGNVAKKRVQETQQDGWRADCRSAVAVDIVHKTDVESSSKQDTTSVITDLTSSPASCSSDVCFSVSGSPVTTPMAPSSGSLQRTVADRLSKFAFKDGLLRQRQQSSTDITSPSPPVCEQSAQHTLGNCHVLALFLHTQSFCVCIQISVVLIHVPWGNKDSPVRGSIMHCSLSVYSSVIFQDNTKKNDTIPYIRTCTLGSFW